MNNCNNKIEVFDLGTCRVFGSRASCFFLLFCIMFSRIHFLERPPFHKIVPAPSFLHSLTTKWRQTESAEDPAESPIPVRPRVNGAAEFLATRVFHFAANLNLDAFGILGLGEIGFVAGNQDRSFFL